MGSRHRVSWAGRPNNTRLPGIPEGCPAPRPMPAHVTPGPNAFAQQEARLHSHRLQGNAFYQAEYQKRRLTPPTAIHPAFREGFSLEDSVSLEDSMAMATASAAGVRDSDLTTMSPFMQSSPGQMPPTPPMLVPDHSKRAYPTDRGFIEDRREKLQHEHAGTQAERTPVFVYSPKVDASEVSKSTSHVTPRKKKAGLLDFTATGEQTKTPKKGFFERLKFMTPRASNVTAPVTSSTTTRGYNVGGETLPPKAKAVLTDSPHHPNLGRSPSKRRGLFFRKVSDQLSLGASTHLANEPRSAGALTVNFSDSTGKTPQTMQTAFTDPTHNRQGQSKRAVSQTQSEVIKENQQQTDKGKNACGVSRTQSLQYFDRTVPPTPPAKNTPPHEKELKLQKEALRKIEDRRQASEERRRESRSNMTPKKEMEQTPASRLRSPIRKAMFDDGTPTRDNAKLMGADGRLSPTKTGTYANIELPTLVKQPSLYSMHGSVFPDLHDQRSFEEMKKCTDGLGLEGLSSLPESFYYREPSITYSPSMYSDDFGARPFSSPNNQHVRQHSPPLPPILEQQRQADEALLSPKRSDLSEATIPCVYPELASDPSRSDLRNDFYNSCKSASTAQAHCETPIRHQGGELAHGSSGSNLIDLNEDALLSSPSYTCPSAMPSPLQILPSTTYTPPCDNKKADSTQGSPSSPNSPSSVRTLTHSSSRKRIEHYKSSGSLMPCEPASPFDRLQFLSPSIRPTFIKSVSPSPTITDSEPEPTKQGRGVSPTMTIGEDTHAQMHDHTIPPISNVAGDTHDHKEYRGVAPVSSIMDKTNVQQAQEPNASQRSAPSTDMQERMQVMLCKMDKQSTHIDSLRAEVEELRARHAQSPKVRYPSDSSATDSCAPQVGSTTNVSTIDVSENPRTIPNEAATSYMAQGSLNQMGLYHRVNQQRVDQVYNARSEAGLARHDQPELRGNTSATLILEDAIDMIDALLKKVKKLEEGK